jgi:molybdopterin-guanine dinucleotide biosynthesis protein B
VKTFGFAGWSGSGKTTLIEKLIPRLAGRGLRVSLIKHAHHSFDVDTPGKDSHRHRQAGAGEILVTSSRRWVLMHELRGAQEPSFDEQVKRLSPCDVLLVEGFKFAPSRSSRYGARRRARPSCIPTIRTSWPSPPTRKCRRSCRCSI